MKLILVGSLALLLAVSSPAVLAQTVVATDAERGKTDAQQDAKKDVSVSRWFGCGVLGGCALTIGILSLIRYSQLLGETADLVLIELVQGIALTVGISGVGGSMVPVSYNMRVGISPPSERFMGKSPEYVTAYLNAYAKSVRGRRFRALLGGYAAGGCIASYVIMYHLWQGGQ